MTTGEDWFGRLYADGYRGLLLTAFALLEDVDEAAAVTRDALAVAYGRRVRLALAESPLEWVRAEVVRRVRRRQRMRALPHRPPAVDREGEAVRLHRLAGLPPGTIASIVDLPVEAVTAVVADAGPVSWGSVPQPVVDRVLARSAQRTTRKRMLTVAAVAVVVLAVAVPLLRVQETAAPAATPPPSTSYPPPDPSHRFVYQVQFADDRHAFALRATCESSDCDLELLASLDGGRWTSRPVGKPAISVAMMGSLNVLGPEEVAVDWYPVSPPGDELYRMHTTDGGRTWRSVPTEPHGSLSAIPPGASLVPGCFGGQDPCDQHGPLVVLPGTGESARLATAPRLLEGYPGAIPLEGDRWWLAGIDPRTKKWSVGISDDDGRTWRVAPLAPPRKNLSDSWSVIGYGRDLYASDMGEVTSGDYALVAIFHSGDGGRSWQRTSGRVPFPTVGSLVAAADGTLLSSTEFGGTLISRDHGRRFTETTKRYTGFAYWAGAGYVTVAEPQSSIMFSRDGLRWRDLNLRS